jgi:hypothetical protein
MFKVRSVPSLLGVVVVSCALMSGCGKDATIEGKEQLAIQLVKAYKTSDDAFSVVSNIQKKFDDDGRAGNKWDSIENWTAGLPSQKDLMMEKLSQFFNVFRPSGDYWARFIYKDKDGVHEGIWDVNIYTKKVTPKNEVAQQLSKGS